MIVPIIGLTPEQEAVLASGADRVMIQRPDGRVAAVVDPRRNKPLFTPEEVAEAERRADSPGPWYTTAEVLAHLAPSGSHEIHGHMGADRAGGVGETLVR